MLNVFRFGSISEPEFDAIGTLDQHQALAAVITCFTSVLVPSLALRSRRPSPAPPVMLLCVFSQEEEDVKVN